MKKITEIEKLWEYKESKAGYRYRIYYTSNEEEGWVLGKSILHGIWNVYFNKS